MIPHYYVMKIPGRKGPDVVPLQTVAPGPTSVHWSSTAMCLSCQEP